MNIEVRYAKSFLNDLKRINTPAYSLIYNFVFVDFPAKGTMHSLPQLRQIDQEGVFYRFRLDNYIIGIELRGEIVKFMRVIPMPDV